ncbi:MAG: hypothetical protein RR573_10150 [Oscillospiraceae bacterium]
MFTAIIKKEKKAQIKLQQFLNNHPAQGLLVFFFCLPIIILAAVFFCAYAAILPIALIMSWF